MPKVFPEHPCLCCGKLTKNYKYCQIKCHVKKSYFCKICKATVGFGYHTRKRFCDTCRPKHSHSHRDWSQVTLHDIFSRLPKFQANARIRALSRVNFRRSKHPRKCQNCGYSKFFEVCHIKPIADFDRSTPLTVVNHIDNLASLCPNCHWELDHGLLELQVSPN
jgi:hypothetical protein